MNIHPELDFVDGQTDDGVEQNFLLQKTEGFSNEAFNPSPEIQIFAFNFLDVALAHTVPFGFKVALKAP